MNAIFKLSVSEFVMSVDADFCAGSYYEDKYQDVANSINDDNDDGVNYHSENYETLDMSHS